MGRMARVVLPGVPHHVTQRGVRRMNVFDSDIDRKYYLKVMRKYCEKYGASVICWCLMSNHIHLIIEPSDESSLSQAVGNAHQAYTRKFNELHGDKGYLFQGRFHSTPMDRPHFYSAVRYVLRNPVRAGMVPDPFAYRWSSVLYNSGLADTDVLVKCNKRLAWVTHWDEYLSDDPEDIDDVRKCTRTGRPCGGDEFIRYAESVTGRRLAKAKPGPKPTRVKVST